MEYKVSVVVPIYGAEKYIERCVRSLFEQTLNEVEYVFVNDCTQDRSIEILKQISKDYPERQGSINIINLTRNEGSAIARATGLKNCHGKYIIQCDSDDWVEHNAYELMYDKAEENNADVVICDFFTTDGKSKKIYPATHPAERLQWISDMLYMKASWSLCNKLFKADIYQNHIVLPRYSMGEDCATALQLAYYCKKIEYVEKPLYYYYNNTASIVNRKSAKAQYNRFFEAMNNSLLVKDFYKTKIEYATIREGIGHVLYYTKCMLLPIIAASEFKIIWKNTCPGIEWKILFDKNNTFKERFKAFFILIGFYPRITNFLGLTKCK